MIPTIGILIAGYICLRCLEILANIKRVESLGSRSVLAIAALSLLLVSIFGIVSLTATSNTVAESLAPLLRR